MHKIIISALIVVFLSGTAFASGGGKIKYRRGQVEFLESELCHKTMARALVHENGASFSVRAWGCTPGDVMTVWAFAGETIVLNCGGGIVLPNGRFKTICDVPMGVIEPCQDCAQVLGPGVLGDPRDVELAIEMLTHDALEPEIALSQIRTLNTCSFFGGPDSCNTVTFISFPVPSHHSHP